ncbi:MAG: transcription repressor NadR [Firmicutes bacterium]|nr:transcription repressor NadR [Bacillota bacterium]
MERRERLQALLSETEAPRTGADLAAEFGVTRQVIVQDMAVLRARGLPIVATPQGYFLVKSHPHERSGRVFRVLTICHDEAEAELELLTLVDAGVEVQDVAVDHPIYGEFVAALMFASRRDVFAFVRRVREQEAPLLLRLADGVHRHTLAAREDGVIEEAVASLGAAGLRVIDLR